LGRSCFQIVEIAARGQANVVSRRVLTVLVTSACVLPLAVAIVLGVARLLGALQDKAAADVLDRVGLAIGIMWAIALVCLVLAQGIAGLGPPSDGRDQ
jgi:hypothetical protein